MRVPVEKQITYDVNSVKIVWIKAWVDGENKLVFVICYKWMNADDKPIRTDTVKYGQDDFASIFSDAGQDMTPFVVSFKELIPTTGQDRSLFVSLRSEPFIFRGIHRDIVDGVDVWTGKVYKEHELEAMDMNSLKAVIGLLSGYLVKA